MNGPQDELSLSRLHDIVEPEAVSLWPSAPGWILLYGLASVLLIVLAFNRYVRWRRDAYRRQALALLPDTPENELNGLLKRVALSHWPREEVASLTGDAWLEFLDRTGGCSFSGGPLLELSYRSEPVEGGAALRAECERWIRRHRRANA